MWANNYLDTDELIDFVKAYDRNYLEWNLRKIIAPVPSMNSKEEFKNVYISLDKIEDEFETDEPEL